MVFYFKILYLLLNIEAESNLWSLPTATAPTPQHTMSSACLLSVENFSQRISLIREVRNAETKGNSQKRLNNNNVVTKHS